MQVVSLFVVALCFALVESTPLEYNGKNVVIFRGESDRFTNVFDCKETNAVCFDKHCTYCQCMVGQTLVTTRDQYGKCVSNELLVYATSYEASFLMQTNKEKRCIYQYPYDTKTTFVLRYSTCVEKNENSRWMWTNYEQLLNWQTLECMTDDYYALKYFPTMKKCNKNNQKQLWECVGDKKYNIKQTQSGRYLHYGEYSSYVTTKYTTPTTWTRLGSEKDVCSQAVGCETFTDGSSLLILNKTKCEEQSECWGKKEIDLTRTRCNLLPNQTQYLHNDTWKPLELKNGSLAITVNTQVFLQWNLTKTPTSWGGLIVKVKFKCEDVGNETEHCVVVKYTGTFKVFYSDGDDDGSNEDPRRNGERNTPIITKILNPGASSPTSSPTSSSTKSSNKSVGKDVKMSWMLYIVPIVVLLFLLIAAFVVVVWYRRRRKKSARSKNSNTENSVTEENTSPVVQELSEYAIPSNDSQPAPRQPQHHSIPDRDHEYQNDCAFGVQPKTPKYELPQNRKYEYPEQLPNHQYEYPDIRVVDGGYSPLVRPPLSKYESENSGYTSLIKGQVSKEVSATGRKDQADRLLYVDVMDGDYTPLVRQPLKDNEAPCYQSLVNNGRKTSEEASATKRKDQGNGLYNDVIDMNGDYTPLARPPLKDNENEVARYEPLLNNGRGTEEMKKPMQRGREKIN